MLAGGTAIALPERSRIGEASRLDASGDTEFRPDMTLADGQVIEGDGCASLDPDAKAHAADHAVFALQAPESYCFRPIMSWHGRPQSSPRRMARGGLHGIARQTARRRDRYSPGHGGPVKARQVHAGPQAQDAGKNPLMGGWWPATAIPQMVAQIYRETDPRLPGGAAGNRSGASRDRLHQGWQSQAS